MILSLINFQYFFDAYPPRIKQKTFLIILFLSLFFVVLAIVLKYLLSHNKKFKKSIDKYQRVFYTKLVDILFTSGLITLFLIYFRKLRVPYFQIRFILILWWGIVLVWFMTLLQHQLIKVPEMREKDAKRREFEKYIK